MVEPLLEVITQFQVFVQQPGVILFRVPFGFPRPDDAQTESYWMNFLAQTFTSSIGYCSPSTTVMWLVGLRIRLALPRPFGMKRRSTGP